MTAAAAAPSHKRLAINFLVLTGGEFASKLLTFAAFSYLARCLHVETYGSLEFALAAMVFFTLPADLGLGVYGAREIARRRDQAARLFAGVVQMRLLLTMVCFAMAVLFSLVVPKGQDVQLLLILYGLSLLSTAFLTQWLFQAHDQMQWVAAASITRQSTFALLVFGFFRPGTPLPWVGVIECASVLVTAAFCLWVAKTQIGVPLRLNRPARELAGHLREALPIGATELAWAFLWYFATVLLGIIFHDESLGWFGAAHRLLMALHTFVWLYFYNLLPSIARCEGLSPHHLLHLMQRSVRITAWTGLLVAFLVTALAREVMALVFGPEFAGGAPVLAILAWMLPVAMLSGHHRYILIAYHQQKRLLNATLIAAGVAVLAGFLFVRWAGAVGAAWALLLANLINFALAYRAVQRQVVQVPFVQQLRRPVSALLCATLIFQGLNGTNPWWSAAAAATVYLTVMVASERRRLAVLARRLSEHPAKSTLAEMWAR